MKVLGYAALGLTFGAIATSAACSCPAVPRANGQYALQKLDAVQGGESDVLVVVDDASNTVTETFSRGGKEYALRYRITRRY